MFRWSSPTSKKTNQSQSVRQRRITLNLEALEARYCLSAASVAAPVETSSDPSSTAPVVVANQGLSLTLSVVPGPGGTATVSGQVSDNLPVAGLTVILSGVVSGSVTTASDGTFTFTGPASALGQIQATVADSTGNTVTASVNFTASPPTIVNFQAIYNGDNSWTFTGQVQGPSVAGLVVSLAGIPSLNNNNASATVQANGTFSYTITLQPGESGGVTAECTDCWGQASNEATAFVWS
jgi:hypothetical protein